MGGSYGGYAALAGATLTPERYACAVSVNGVSDPEYMLKDANRAGKTSMVAEWWRKSMGSDMDHLRKVSPLRHADQVRIPILLLHGIDDSVVPIEQSRSMNKKLLAREAQRALRGTRRRRPLALERIDPDADAAGDREVPGAEPTPLEVRLREVSSAFQRERQPQSERLRESATCFRSYSAAAPYLRGQRSLR